MSIAYAEAIIAFFAWVIFCAYVSPSELWKSSSEAGISMKVFSWLTALGVCVFTHTFLYERMLTHREAFDKMLGLLHVTEHVFYYALFAVSLLSLVVVYLCTNYFWHKFLKLIKSSGMFSDMRRSEIVFYVLLFAVSIVFVTSAFMKTNIFYGDGLNNPLGNSMSDLMYMSDTGILVGRNCFINIAHGQNDTKQALFGVFALPFMGVPYLAGRIVSLFFGHRELVTALIMNYAQIAMLIAGIFVLTKIMGLSPLYRVFFTVCFSCSYTYLLALLMMEQYIIAFFWLSLCIYFVCNSSEPERMTLYGAGGTLTTSLVFTPFYLGGGGG